MALEAFRCPNCQAALRVADQATQVTCEYCSTTSRVRRRTRLFETAVPLPKQAHTVPIAVQRHSLRWIVICSTVLPAIVVAGVAITSQRFASTGSRAGLLDSGNPSWKLEMRDAPVVGDFDGDGNNEVIVRVRPNESDSPIGLAVFDANTGEMRWHLHPLGNYASLSNGLVAAHKGHAYLAGETGTATVINLKDRSKQTFNLGEKVKRFCHTQTEVWVETADERWRSLGSAANPAQAEAPLDCNGIPTEGQHAHLDPAWNFVPRKLDNMRVDFALLAGDGFIVAVGTKQPGSPVPMVARYSSEVAPDLKRTVPWKSRRKREKNLEQAVVQFAVEVPISNKLNARRLSQKNVSVANGVVAVAYQQDISKPSVVTVFDLTDGTRLFSRVVGKHIFGLHVFGNRLYIAGTAALLSIDARTGEDPIHFGDVPNF